VEVEKIAIWEECRKKKQSTFWNLYEHRRAYVRGLLDQEQSLKLLKSLREVDLSVLNLL
jgi:hypothetical protein